jgi:flagellar FliJ protein
MRKFTYRFEKILAYRRHLEKQKQRDLAQVQQVEQNQRQKLSDIADDRVRTQGEQASFLVGAIEPRRLSGYSRYYLRLRHQELTGREVLKQISKEVERKRQILIEAARQKKIYEKLKDRHWNRFQHEYNLLMQKDNDDVGQKIYLQHR